MIERIGVDLVSVERIRRAMERPGFTDRVLSVAERRESESAEYVAGRWAAKEALVKCLAGLCRIIRS